MLIHQSHNSGGNHNYNAYFYENCQWYLHFHKNYELAFVLEGQTEITVNGQTFPMHRGQLALVLPQEPHAYTTPEHSLVWICVFSADFVEAFARGTAQKKVKNPVFSCTEAVEMFLRQTVITQKRQDILMLKAALYAVCSEFSRSAVWEDSVRDTGFTERTVAFVASRFTEDITMQDLADCFGYEYHYVSRLFHRHFYMHFKQFLNIYRTEFARDQLLHTDTDITQIALQSGFQNCRSFNRAFLQQMGMTPSQYRTQVSNAEPVSFPATPVP